MGGGQPLQAVGIILTNDTAIERNWNQNTDTDSEANNADRCWIEQTIFRANATPHYGGAIIVGVFHHNQSFAQVPSFSHNRSAVCIRAHEQLELL